jgi:IS5 family transposase
MKKRVASLTRIGKLASQMHELGKWRLSAIQQEQASLSDDLRAVFEALESGDLAYGAQAKLSARRIRGLQKRLDTLERESEQVQRVAHVHGMRAKLAEHAAETADKAYREHEARKELADFVERALMRRDASQG